MVQIRYFIDPKSKIYLRKCLIGEMVRRRDGNLRNCQVGEMSHQENVWAGKCAVEEPSSRGTARKLLTTHSLLSYFQFHIRN